MQNPFNCKLNIVCIVNHGLESTKLVALQTCGHKHILRAVRAVK
jgi:hypothetical protein